MRNIIICGAAVLITACGPEKTNEASGSVDPTAADKPTSTVSKSGGATLSLTPISFADAVGETSKIIEVGPCPFVSDDMIKASVRTSFAITRREVSNKKCRWSYNAGFAIDVSIEDLSTAKPISERRYNIGVDTVLEPQDGPGQNAVLLNDMAWDRSIPFAYSFGKDGKLVFMHYTGFKTNAEIMRPAANEIAARMGSAPKIEHQRRHATQSFKPCEVWNKQDLISVFNIAETAIVSLGMMGTTTCNWKIYEDGASGYKTAGFNIYKPEPGKKAAYEYDGHTSYSANGETHYLRKAPSDYGTFIHIVTPRPEGLVYVTVSDPSEDATAVAKALQNNLLSRMAP